MNSCRQCCGSHTPYPVGRRIASLIPPAHIVSLVLYIGVFVASEKEEEEDEEGRMRMRRRPLDCFLGYLGANLGRGQDASLGGFLGSLGRPLGGLLAAFLGPLGGGLLGASCLSLAS